MSSAKSTISVVEAAYDLHGSEQQWLRRISQAAAPALDRGLGVLSHAYDARQVPLGVSSVVYLDVPRRVRPVFRRVTGSLDSSVSSTYSTPLPCLTSRDALGELPDWLAAEYARGGVYDVFAVNAAQGDGTGVLVSAAWPRRAKLSRDEAWRWSLVSAHIAAGARLRRGLLAGSARLLEGEAVLGPDGRVADARGAAKAKSARDALHRAVRDMERARGRLRKSDPDEALQIWRALVAGRWSLVDRFDSDGRRFLVARKNDPQLSDPRRLTRRERQVVAFAAIGHPNKLIGYELGLGPTTVSSHLRSAMGKLGVRTHAELLSRLR